MGNAFKNKPVSIEKVLMKLITCFFVLEISFNLFFSLKENEIAF